MTARFPKTARLKRNAATEWSIRSSGRHHNAPKAAFQRSPRPFEPGRPAFVDARITGYAFAMPEPLVPQPTLFGNEEPGCDESFGSLRRIELERGAWIDVVPSWMRGHAKLFDALARDTAWRSEERKM